MFVQDVSSVRLVDFPQPQNDLEQNLAEITSQFIEGNEAGAISRIKALPQDVQNELFERFYVVLGRPDIPHVGEKLLEEGVPTSFILKATTVADYVRTHLMPDNGLEQNLVGITRQFFEGNEAGGISGIKALPQDVQNELFERFYVVLGRPDIPHVGEKLLEEGVPTSFILKAKTVDDYVKTHLRALADFNAINARRANVDYPAVSQAGRMVDFPRPQNDLEQNLAEITSQFIEGNEAGAISRIKALPQDVQHKLFGHFYLALGRPQIPDIGEKLFEEGVSTSILKAKTVADYVRTNLMPDDEARALADFNAINERRDNVDYPAVSQAGRMGDAHRFNQWDVVPYDATRVTLSDGTYVNASRVFDRFLLTQSPVAEKYTHTTQPADTAPPFWQMVDESGTDIIVMLNGERNYSKPSYFPYFPHTVGETLSFGDRSISLLKDETYAVRIFGESEPTSLSDRTMLLTLSSGEKRVVHHLKANSWWDSTCGDEPTVLKLIELFTKYDTRRAPAVIHCGAGVGRTSQFLTTLLLESKARSGEAYSVKETVLAQIDPNTGRCPYMLENLDQYLAVVRTLRNMHQ